MRVYYLIQKEKDQMEFNNYEVEVLVSDLTRQLEDLSYRLFRIEDEIADLKAYMEDQKED